MNEPAPCRDLHPVAFDAADVERTRLRRRVRRLEEDLAYAARENARLSELVADQALKLDKITGYAIRYAQRLVEGRPRRPGEPLSRAEAFAEIEAIAGPVLVASAAPQS